MLHAVAASALVARPKLIVFDLDNTLWSPELYQLRKKPKANKDVRLCAGAVDALYDLATGDWPRTEGAVASRATEADWAEDLLAAFEVEGRSAASLLRGAARWASGSLGGSWAAPDLEGMDASASVPCAVKKVRLSELGAGLNELKCLLKLKRHANVVRVYGQAEDGDEYLYLALELCHGTLDGLANMVRRRSRGWPALRADLDLRATLYQQIVLAGGSTLFPGFGERLLKELRLDLPDHTKIKIHAPPERMLSTWIGGSILASLATFKSMWVLRAEFEEHGARLFSQRAL